jgi:hypothetical protein
MLNLFVGGHNIKSYSRLTTLLLATAIYCLNRSTDAARPTLYLSDINPNSAIPKNPKHFEDNKSLKIILYSESLFNMANCPAGKPFLVGCPYCIVTVAMTASSSLSSSEHNSMSG